MTNPDGPLALPLIHKGDIATGDWGWPSWFRCLGLPKSGAAAGSLTLGDMGLCMSAAAEGAGVTLGRSLLVADAVSSGRLMSALADYPTVECTKIQVAQWPADLIGDRSVELFVNWLAEQAETTVRIFRLHGPFLPHLVDPRIDRNGRYQRATGPPRRIGKTATVRRSAGS